MPMGDLSWFPLFPPANTISKTILTGDDKVLWRCSNKREVKTQRERVEKQRSTNMAFTKRLSY